MRPELSVQTDPTKMVLKQETEDAITENQGDLDMDLKLTVYKNDTDKGVIQDLQVTPAEFLIVKRKTQIINRKRELICGFLNSEK